MESQKRAPDSSGEVAGAGLRAPPAPQWGRPTGFATAMEHHALEEELARGIAAELALLGQARFADASGDRIGLSLEVPELPQNREWRMAEASAAGARGDLSAEIRELRAAEERTRERLRLLEQDMAWLREQITPSARDMGRVEEREAEAAALRLQLYHQELARRRAVESGAVDAGHAATVEALLGAKGSRAAREHAALAALEARELELEAEVAALADDLRLNHGVPVRAAADGGGLLLPSMLPDGAPRPASAARKVRVAAEKEAARDAVRARAAEVRARAVPGSLDYAGVA